MEDVYEYPAPRRYRLLVVCLLLGLCVAVAYAVVRPDNRGAHTTTLPTHGPAPAPPLAVIAQLKAINRWSTAETSIQTVVAREVIDSRWGIVYGRAHLVYLALLTAEAGCDLSSLAEGDVRVDGSDISIRLPQPVITHLYLDVRRSEVYLAERSLFSSVVLSDLLAEAQSEALERARGTVQESALLDEAERNARALVESSVRALGYRGINVTFAKS